MCAKKIFLSHSTRDQKLARALYNLMNQFISEKELDQEYELFYAPEDLNCERGTRAWKESIEKNMRESSRCIVLFTPNSVENRWVNYELGLASALQKTQEMEITLLSVAGLDFNLVLSQGQLINISIFKNVINTISIVFNRDRAEVRSWGNDKDIKPNIEQINFLARERCVYFVGSQPVENKTSDEWVRNAHAFIENMVDGLLDEGFKLASFPVVKHVGELVANHVFRREKGSRYEIAGLYRFDRMMKAFLKTQQGDTRLWDKTITEFRKVYLANKDCMIIVGGNQNTRNEYDVAKSLTDKKIQIFPIPCFGGFGRELFERLSRAANYAKFKHPCSGCDYKHQNEPCPRVGAFLERLGAYEVPYADR